MGVTGSLCVGYSFHVWVTIFVQSLVSFFFFRFSLPVLFLFFLRMLRDDG